MIQWRWDFSRNTKTEKHKPGRSALESQNQNISAQNRNAQTNAYNNVNSTDSQFSGPVQDTPYYKSLVATGTDATSKAYQNAQANSISQANEAGFGTTSPIGQAASREETGQEAGALAEIPAKAAAATAPLQLEASGQQLSEGGTLGNEALGYQGEATNLEEQYAKQQQDFWNTLLGAGEAGAGMGLKAAGVGGYG